MFWKNDVLFFLFWGLWGYSYHIIPSMPYNTYVRAPVTLPHRQYFLQCTYDRLLTAVLWEPSLPSDCLEKPTCFDSSPALRASNCIVRVPTHRLIPSPLSPPPLRSKCICESLWEVHQMISKLWHQAWSTAKTPDVMVGTGPATD